MPIYTRKGDSGTTSTYTGQRLRKDDLLFSVHGELDALSSHLGVLLTLVPREVKSKLRLLQQQLQDLNSDLTSCGQIKFKPSSRELEGWIDDLTAILPELKSFILPGGRSHTGAYAHVCRAQCRRAERELVRLSAEVDFVTKHHLAFINRLSDYLFQLSRYLDHQAPILSTERWLQILGAATFTLAVFALW